MLTFVALRDSAPLAGLARAASLSSESSDSSGSLILMTWLLFGFLDFKLEFTLSDRVTATPFADVVRDFDEMPEAREIGTLLLVVSTGWEELKPELSRLLPELLTGGAFLLSRLGWIQHQIRFREVYLPLIQVGTLFQVLMLNLEQAHQT